MRVSSSRSSLERASTRFCSGATLTVLWILISPRVARLVRELADNGVAVVVISSEMEEVLALGDRIMVMHQGHTKGFIDDVEYTTEEDVLQMAFK